jgi:uncharacterized protein YjbI with pentapeptide repeats
MADPDHVALARQGPEALSRFVAENPSVALDLSGADLSGLDLHNCRLQGARLDGTDLSRCDLRNVRFNSASLKNALLRDADARGASFHRADLTGADLRGLRLNAIGIGGQRICIGPLTFEGTRWDRDQLERILALINLNPDWEVRYEIAPKRRGAGD